MPQVSVLSRAGWAGRGAEALGLLGPVDPETFRSVLEGEVPDGSGRRLGRPMGDGEVHHRPGRDLTFSAPKSVSLAALVGDDARIVDIHDRAGGRALDWFDRNAAETRVRDKSTGRMVRAGDPKTVIARFRHETSRNLDPALHTHSVIANMLLGADGKWRTMANKSLYASKMLLGALYRGELAGELAKLGLRDRADPCRRALRDRRRLATHHGCVLDTAGRDRGGDGGPGPGLDGGQPASRPARGARIRWG